MTVGPYKQSGQGTIWIDPEDREKVIEKIKEAPDHSDEQILGSWSNGTFQTEEIYIDKNMKKGPVLRVTGGIEEAYVSIDIPIRPTDEVRRIIKDLMSIVDLRTEESGLFLKPKDFKEIRLKTADGQGRINLGSDRAGKDIRVVIMDVIGNE